MLCLAVFDLYVDVALRIARFSISIFISLEIIVILVTMCFTFFEEVLRGQVLTDGCFSKATKGQ
jgi:hypothetical protein